jgi:hypothetical protein
MTFDLKQAAVCFWHLVDITTVFADGRFRR